MTLHNEMIEISLYNHVSRESCNSTILGRLKRATSQRAEARWLVVERYLKNLIEKSPASVCIISLIFPTYISFRYAGSHYNYQNNRAVPRGWDPGLHAESNSTGLTLSILQSVYVVIIMCMYRSAIYTLKMHCLIYI